MTCTVSNPGRWWLCLLVLWVPILVVAQTTTRPDCRAFSAQNVAKVLSETCLYEDIKTNRVSAQLTAFAPNYPLWTDGAGKTRWVYLPASSTIDTSDPDGWIFPKGTLFFKEFRRTVAKDLYSTKDIKVETRVLAKVKDTTGADAWLKLAYAWDSEQRDARLSAGYENVLGTNHDIPSEEQCVQCHQGKADFVLGFEALQLSGGQVANNINAIEERENVWTLPRLQAAGRLSHLFEEQPIIPGSKIARNALGYMHGNCGHCHNPLGEAFKKDVEHLILNYLLKETILEETPVYRTAVNQLTRNFTRVPYIVKGAQDDELAIYESAIFVRMNSLLPKNRMPLIDSKEIDYAGLDQIHQWIQSLPTPDDLDLITEYTSSTQTAQPFEARTQAPGTAEKGLVGTLSFSHEKAVPKVAIIYLPEDEGLDAQPILDHDAGDFTRSLIVGTPGEIMVLKNSDEIGHTIYAEANDKRYWDIDYMPANSATSRKISWEVDEFVELKCKIHSYMKAWAGGIRTRYYKIIEPHARETPFRVKTFPPGLSQVKVWMPDYDPVVLSIKAGQQISRDLIRKGRVRGTLVLTRN